MTNKQLVLCEQSLFFNEASPLWLYKHTFRTVELNKAIEMVNSETVQLKLIKLQNKKFIPVTSKDELNELQKKIIENRIKEMEERIKTTSGSVDNNLPIGGSVSKSSSKKELRNFVVMNIDKYLCIVEGNDKGRIISITIILNKNGTMKFLEIQKSLFKF